MSAEISLKAEESVDNGAPNVEIDMPHSSFSALRVQTIEKPSKKNVSNLNSYNSKTPKAYFGAAALSVASLLREASIHKSGDDNAAENALNESMDSLKL